MIGNSVRSDVLPVLDIGGWAVHVPYMSTWAIEHAAEPTDHPRYRRADALADVVAIVESVAGHEA
jgi:putative hydrolase of the HAD superfamily